MDIRKDIISTYKRNTISYFNSKFVELLDEQLNYWISFLKEKLSKRLYKRILKEISTKQLMEKYKNCSRVWELIIISIKTKLKIINHKIIKYNFNINEIQKIKTQINHCKKYLDLIKEEFNELFNNNETTIKKLLTNLEMVDQLILCYSEYIYVSFLFNKGIGNFMESLNYLTLIINFYKETNLLIKSKSTLFYIQKCYILLCQILISNKDYLTAMDYLNIIIGICFKNILYSVDDINNGVYIGNNEDIKYNNYIENKKSNINSLKTKKIFLNIIIIFLYKAICHENLGNIKKSLQCVKQCNWFSFKFLNEEKFNIFCSFIERIKERYAEFKITYDNFIKKIKEKEKFYLLKSRLEKDKNNQKIINYTKYYSSNDKYKELIRKIDKLKIKEIDTVSRFTQKKNIKNVNLHRRAGKDKIIYLDNMRLIEAYLRKDFQSIIIDMDKIKLFDLDYNTRERIQHQIYRSNFEKILKSNKIFEKFKSAEISLNKSFKDKIKSFSENKNSFKIQKYKSVIQSLTPKNKLTKLKHIFNRKDCNDRSDNNNSNNKEKKYNESKHSIKEEEESAENNDTKKMNNKLIVHLYKKIKKKKEIEDERKMNSFFNKNYLRKRNFIKTIEDKELKFQKLYLKSKNKPNFPIPSTDELVIKRQANNYFNKLKMLVNVKSTNEEDNINMGSDESNTNNSLFKSLDSNNLNDYYSLRKSRKNKIMKILNSDEVEKNNKSIIDKLNLTISEIIKTQATKNKDALFKKIKNNNNISYLKRYTSISPRKESNKFILSPNKFSIKRTKK